MIDLADPRTRAASSVVTDLTRLGAEVPPNIADAVAAATGAKKALDDLAALGSDDNLGRLIAARANGEKISATDLTDGLLGAILATRPYMIEATQKSGGRGVLRAVVRNTDAVIESLRPVFDKAAGSITEARAVLGSLALDDLAGIANLGGDAAAHWKAGKAAEVTIATIQGCVGKLITAGAYASSLDQRERALSILDTDLAGYKQIGRNAGAWELSALGRLDLASQGEHAARLGRINEAWGKDPQNRDNRLAPGVGQYPVGRAVDNTPAPVAIGGVL